MNNVTNLTKNLIDAIITSEDYLNYQAAKRIIDLDFTLKSKLNYFKTQQFNMEVQLAQGVSLSYEEKENLQNLYIELTLDDALDTYLRYEESILDTIDHIYDEIVNSIDIDLDFMESPTSLEM